MQYFGSKQSGEKLDIRLTSYAQNTLVVFFGLLPLFFVPLAAAPFGYSKVLFVLVGIALALALYGAASLASGSVRGSFSWSPAFLWVVALATLVSALLSGDFLDAFIGDAFSVHSALFVGLLALTASVWMLLGSGKRPVMRLFILLAASTLALVLFHLVRLVFGPETLSLGFFGADATLSPLGGWNDLAIFFGLTVILSLIALEQLALTRAGQALFCVVVLAALVMLGVVNFAAVWVVLGIVSLMVLVYGLTKGRLSDTRKTKTSGVSIGVSLLVLIVSATFFIGGGALGGMIASWSDISYLEVRPSIEATSNIVREVYRDDLLFGVGPNRFADAWRMHRDPSINGSIFWETDFSAGFGYLPTFAATAGIVGAVAWMLFLALFVYGGLRMLLRSAEHDRTWYFIGTVSFTGGVYLWTLAILYVPGPVLLLLAALCTGLTAAADAALAKRGSQEFAALTNPRSSFVLVAVFLILILGSVSVLYLAGRHYTAAYTFNQSLVRIAEGAPLTEVEERTVAAYNLSENDVYARRLAEYQRARMEQLLTVPEPTDEQRAEFSAAIENGIAAGQVAIERDGTDPRNHDALGRLFGLLVSVGVEGAYERALQSFERAAEYDPQNPRYALARAELAYLAGNEPEARAEIQMALEKKRNYTDAIFFLAQIDIAAGDTAAAIEATRAVTLLEPQNPVRFFQLGVLQYSEGAYADAARALERSVLLNESYSNARYYLALTYDALGRSEEAREQLTAVLRLNPGNELVLALLERLQQGERLAGDSPQGVEESSGVEVSGGTVTSLETPDTSLVSPVNTPPEGEGSTQTE